MSATPESWANRSSDSSAISTELRDALLLATELLRKSIVNGELDVREALRLKDLLGERIVNYESSRRAGYLLPDGRLRLAEWVDHVPGGYARDRLRVSTAERPTRMEGTHATGEGLVSNGHLGADVIRCAAGGGFAPHTHIGDHLLLVIAGEGTIAYDGRIYPTFPGQAYFVEGAVPHAVGAITDHVLISVGAPHRAVDAPDRQALQEYETILADFTSLRCEICGLEAEFPTRLADVGCPHCPSRFC